MKKLIAWTLTLVLVLSLAPRFALPVSAEGAPEPHSHSAAQHDCECGKVSCTEEGHKKVVYEPWTDTTSLPSSGNYYLTANVNLADETSVTADLNLCLNGYTVTAASGKQIITTPKNNTLTLVISDCTAHTDGSGNYTAGKLTGGVDKGNGRGGGAIQIRDKGNLKLYDGIITGNTSDTSGGAIRLGAGTTFLMGGGEISGNTAINGSTLKSGGAISMVAGGSMTILGGTIKNNSGSEGGAIYTQSDATIKNCHISGNTAGKGGAVYISGGAVLTMENCTVKDNQMNAAGAGAVYVTGSTANLTGCTITGNKGLSPANSGASAVYSAANSTVKLHDCTITDNSFGGTATAFFGTVYLANATEKLTLSGKTVISGNTVAADGTPVEQNVYLRSIPNTPVDIGGLTDGAMLSIRTHGKTVMATTQYLKYTAAPTDWDQSYVRYENNGMEVGYNSTDGFHYVESLGHTHCVCGTDACGVSTHDEVEYQPWNDKTSLPSAGNYYLNTDVTMDAETSVSADLNLCLNGHTVTAAEGKRHLSTPKDLAATVTISDCTATTVDGVYTAGSLTGGADKGNGTGGGSIYIRTGGALKLYDGIITGNTSLTGGGAIAMNNKTTFLMAGGEISNNQAISGTALKNGGGLLLRNGCTAQITGGTIKNNTALNGGGIYLEANNAVISGCTISENTAQAGAAVYVAKNKTATFKNCQISENETSGAGGAAIYLNTATVTLEGCTMTGNAHTSAESAGSSAIYSPSTSTITLKDCTITGGKVAGTASSFRGAVYTAGATEKLILIGNVVIKDNFVAVDGTPVERNIYLQRKPATPVDVGGLTSGAELSIFSHWGTESTPTMVKADTEPTGWIRGMVTYDNNGMAVDYDATEKIFYFAINAEHIHCLCGEAECADSTHEMTGYRPWNDKTSLPTAGNYYLITDVVLAAETNVSADLNLCLNGHTVTAAKDKRHMSTPANTNVTIILSDCTATTVDGVYTAGKLTGGVDKGNGQGGGSVYLRTGATLKLYDGIITNSTSITGGGGIRVNKGAYLYMYGGEVSNNTAIKNDAKQIGGGISGIAGSFVEIHGGTIKNNTGSNGGGIFSQGTLTVSGGTISDNTSAQGGGIYTLRANVVLNGGLVTGNYAEYGGALLAKGCTVELGGIRLDGNTASKTGGGIRVVYDVQGEKVNLNTVTMTAGSVSNNKANEAGGILLEGDGTVMTMTGGEISGNQSAVTAGGLYAANKTQFIMEGGQIANNRGKHAAGIRALRSTIILKGGKITGNRSVMNGGGVYVSNENGKLCLQGAEISNNTAEKGAGVLVESKAVMEMSAGTISGNTVTKDGGGAILVSTDCAFTMTGGTITRNNGRIGAGLYAYRATVTLAGGTISYNTATKEGGGVRHIGGKLYLRGTNIIGNTAKEGNGGGIKAAAATTTKNGVSTIYPAYIYMYAGTISHNQAVAGGGGAIDHRGSTWEIYGGTMHDNKAQTQGGALYSSSFTNVKVSGLKAYNNESGQSGGAVYHYKSTTSYKDCVFTNNTTATNGGALYFSIYCKTAFENVVCEKNTSGARGGAVYLEFETPATFKNCSFTENQSVYGGGVFASYTVDMTMENCKFQDNTATTSGGGLYVFDMGTLTDCLFTGNKATRGGAILSGNDGLMKGSNGWGANNAGKIGMKLYNCELTGNEATEEGGALYMAMSCRGYLRNSTFTGNTAGISGSAIWCTEDVDMADLIITGNKAPEEGYAVVLAEAGFDGMSYFRALVKISGDLLISENEGGDMYLGKQTTVTISPEGLGKNAKLGVTLDSGLLTQRLFGTYDYEGGDCVYTVTYGERSLTDPEYDPTMVVKVQSEAAQQEKAPTADTWLYVVIGIFAAAVVAVIAWLTLKRKKSGAAETK